MPTLFLGLVVLVLLLFAAKWFFKSDPKQAARVLRYLGGGAALLLAGFLLVRGQIAAALSIGLLGLGVLGHYFSPGPTSFGGRTQKTAGRVSRVRTAFLEMELEHDSGAMRGRVLNGTHQGAELDRLDVKTLIGLLCQMDQDSRRRCPPLVSGSERASTGVNKRPEDEPGQAEVGTPAQRKNDRRGGLSDPRYFASHKPGRDRSRSPLPNKETTPRTKEDRHISQLRSTKQRKSCFTGIAEAVRGSKTFVTDGLTVASHFSVAPWHGLHQQGKGVLEATVPVASPL